MLTDIKLIEIISVGGLLGSVTGAFWLRIPKPYHKLTLSYVMSVFDLVQIYLIWVKPPDVFDALRLHNRNQIPLIFTVGLLGGVLSANVDRGIEIDACIY